MTDTLQSMPATLRDRSTLLTVFGIFEILLGILAAGMVLLMIVAQVFMRSAMLESPPPSQPGMMMGLFIYVIAAVALIWLGIGSIMARRWARALMLVCSSLALVVGIVALLAMLLVLPHMTGITPPGAPEVPQGVVIGAMIFGMVVMFFIYIVLPTTFVLVYRSKHVKATCEWRDPKIRWTDKCPLPVLALSILCAFGVPCLFLTAVTMPVFPLPNGIATGLGVGIVLACMGIVMACSAWGTYKLKPAAWWVLFVMMALCFLYGGFILGTGRIDWMAYYAAAGIPAEQINMIQAMGMLEVMQSPAILILTLLYAVLYFGYLLYVKRFFAKNQPQ